MSVGAPNAADELTAVRSQLTRANIRAAIERKGADAEFVGQRLFELAEADKDEVALGALREIRAWLKDDDAAARGPTTLNATFNMGQTDMAQLVKVLSDVPPDKRREVFDALGLSEAVDVPLVSDGRPSA